MTYTYRFIKDGSTGPVEIESSELKPADWLKANPGRAIVQCRPVGLRNARARKKNKAEIYAEYAIDNGYSTIATISHRVYDTVYYNTYSSHDVHVAKKFDRRIAIKTGLIECEINWLHTITKTELKRRTEEKRKMK